MNSLPLSPQGGVCSKDHSSRPAKPHSLNQTMYRLSLREQPDLMDTFVTVQKPPSVKMPFRLMHYKGNNAAEIITHHQRYSSSGQGPRQKRVNLTQKL